MKPVTAEDQETGCELCGKMGFHVTEAYCWGFADIPPGKKQPKEGATVVQRCDGLEKFASDRGAARAAKNAGVDVETQWPYYVSAKGVRTWRKMIGLQE